MSGAELSAGFFIQFFQRYFSSSVIEFQDDHGITAVRAFNGIIAKSVNDGISPGREGHVSLPFFSRNGSADQVIRISMASIDTIVANHLKMLFRDVADKTFNKVYGRDGFRDELIILVTIIVEGNGVILFVIGINTGSSDDRSPEISADVFENLVRITFARFQVNIEPIFRMLVDLCLDSFEFWRKFLLKKI